MIENGSILKLRSVPKGLKNNGNTCYFNSILQSISSCPSFILHLKHLKSIETTNNSNDLCTELLNSFKGECSVVLSELIL